jgi:hypothetical protein
LFHDGNWQEWRKKHCKVHIHQRVNIKFYA